MPRILIATVIGLVGFVAYVVAAVTLADLMESAHWAAQALFFLVAGLLWVIPARSLMYWAARK
jgi:sugar phosphate permease